TIFDETTLFSTRKHKLKIQKTDLEKISIVLKESLIYVNYPAQTDVSSTEVQQAVKNGIEKALRIEAKEYLPGRVQELAEKFCFEYNKVFLKNLRSRWGSCSHKNNINLNIHLMRLPDKLIDYVIFHELTHTVEKNHSKKFWALLKTLNTDSKKLDKELKKYSPLKLSV
ncbi:MAG: M48 family metallopeptidase, partial [Melioribacteraceae bacterium]|nr:M48 family metallopeptidase [Melioribacteraceae bacterium]